MAILKWRWFFFIVSACSVHPDRARSMGKSTLSPLTRSPLNPRHFRLSLCFSALLLSNQSAIGHIHTRVANHMDWPLK